MLNKLLSYLQDNCRGKENAATGAQLVFYLGFTDIRALQKAIYQLRQDGHFIGSKSDVGYWYAVSESEALDCIHEFSSRFRKMRRTVDRLEASYKERFGNQIKLDMGVA